MKFKMIKDGEFTKKNICFRCKVNKAVFKYDGHGYCPECKKQMQSEDRQKIDTDSDNTHWMLEKLY